MRKFGVTMSLKFIYRKYADWQWVIVVDPVPVIDFEPARSTPTNAPDGIYPKNTPFSSLTQ